MNRQDYVKELPSWIRTDGDASDVVLSSRIRLARNIKGLTFPNYANEQQLQKINEEIQRALNKPSPFGLLKIINIEELSAIDRMLLVETHLCSPQFIEQPHLRQLVTNEEKTISLMVNEEDHLRIQTITPGFSLDQGLALINEVDDYLEETLEFCFNEVYGYLTACPTNVGTGIRASLMLHLPGLTMVDQMQQIMSALTHVGINIRGLYGEGTESLGDIYQISNQVTLGHSEPDLTNNLKSVCRQVVEQERSVRETLVKKSRVQLEDRICRSYGLLKEARLLTSQEALKLLSDVKLGAEIGIIEKVDKSCLKELLFIIRSALLQKVIGQKLAPEERDFYRAMLVRDKLKI